MKKWMRRLALVVLPLFLVYLIAGAVIPFVRYLPVTEETQRQIADTEFYQNAPGQERVMLLETNQSAWDERMRMLQLAEKEIIFSTFDIRDGESARDVMAVLLKKAEDGVKVRMLVDGFSGLIRMEGRDVFYALSSHPNIEIRIYNPINLLAPWKTQGRMHDKYLIVDDDAFILGGRNTFDYFIGSYPTDSRSYDREVLVYNPDPAGGPGNGLLQIRNYFEKIWELPVCRPFHDSDGLAEQKSVQEERTALENRYDKLSEENPEFFSLDEAECRRYYERNTLEAGKITLISNPTGIYAKEPVVFASIAQLIRQAKSSVILHSPYIVLNDYMYETLQEASASVPDIRIMVNSVENGDNFFASSDYIRHKKELAALGIPIYEYDGGMSYHGKSLVIDQKLSLVGSYNLDLRSTYLDTELMLAIESPGLADELTGYMETFHKDCRLLLKDGSYEIPSHLAVASVHAWKKAAWAVVGFLMQPFRFLI